MHDIRTYTLYEVKLQYTGVLKIVQNRVVSSNRVFKNLKYSGLHNFAQAPVAKKDANAPLSLSRAVSLVSAFMAANPAFHPSMTASSLSLGKRSSACVRVMLMPPLSPDKWPHLYATEKARSPKSSVRCAHVSNSSIAVRGASACAGGNEVAASGLPSALEGACAPPREVARPKS